jgi:hypothetical protein
MVHALIDDTSVSQRLSNASARQDLKIGTMYSQWLSRTNGIPHQDSLFETMKGVAYLFGKSMTLCRPRCRTLLALTVSDRSGKMPPPF